MSINNFDDIVLYCTADQFMPPPGNGLLNVPVALGGFGGEVFADGSVLLHSLFLRFSKLFLVQIMI